jgi:hypothetical protein
MLLCCAALTACILLPGAAPTPPPAETVIRLTVQPMPVPNPVLRYMLLPELKELNPGNPVPGYLKCFAEQQGFFFNKEACERRDKLLVMPLKDLPAQELRDYGKAALRQADWAARLDRPDWQLLLKLKTDGINLLVPEVQQMRTLANALKVRFRAEVALHQYDDATRTARTMFAMARHLGEHPTLIGDLVGIAIASVAIGPLEEMLEQPGCPNLYWALTRLPRPLVSLEPGAQSEQVWFAGEFPWLDDKAPMSEEQIKKTIAHCEKVKGLAERPVGTFQEYLNARTKDEGLVRAARRRLADVGLPEERLSRFPAEQVILLDEVREYESRAQEQLKLIALPPWQFDPLYRRLESEVIANKEKPAFFADLLLSSMHKVHQAQGRLDQRIALLRHVEALRLYAADHDGRLPQTLADVAVPLPEDPFTGKPFRYSVEGNTAHLRGSPPPGREKEAPFNVHYVITVQK